MIRQQCQINSLCSHPSYSTLQIHIYNSVKAQNSSLAGAESLFCFVLGSVSHLRKKEILIPNEVVFNCNMC